MVEILRPWAPSSPPPAKRLRLEDEEDDDELALPSALQPAEAPDDKGEPEPSAPTLIKSGNFYFIDSDATMRLIVEDKIVFRVHKSRFKGSEVLQGLLSTATRTGVEDEPAPVAGKKKRKRKDIISFHLPDNARAFELLLQFMYHGSTFAISNPSLNQMRAVLLLADKYQLPTTLHAARALFHDLFYGQLKEAFDQPWLPEYEDLGSRPSPEILHGCLDVCLQFGIAEPLPMIYYLLAADKGAAMGALIKTRPVADAYGWKREGLTRTDLLRIFQLHSRDLVAQRRLLTNHRQLLGTLAPIAPPNGNVKDMDPAFCARSAVFSASHDSSLSCSSYVEDRWRMTWKGRIQGSMDANAVGLRRILKGMLADTKWGVCSPCAAVVRREVREGIRNLDEEIGECVHADCE